MDSLAKTGKTYLLVILSAIVAPSIFNLTIRTLFLPQSIGITELLRWTFTLILVFADDRGYSGARAIICIILLLTGGIVGPILVAQILAENLILGILLILLSVFYVFSGIFINRSKAIENLFKYQQSKRKE